MCHFSFAFGHYYYWLSMWDKNNKVMSKFYICGFSFTQFLISISSHLVVKDRIECKSTQLQLFTMNFKGISVMVTWTVWFRLIKNSRHISFSWLFNWIYYCRLKINGSYGLTCQIRRFHFDFKKLERKIKYSVCLCRKMREKTFAYFVGKNLISF